MQRRTRAENCLNRLFQMPGFDLHALSLKPGSVDGAKVKPYLELGQASMVPDAIRKRRL